MTTVSEPGISASGVVVTVSRGNRRTERERGQDHDGCPHRANVGDARDG